MRKSRFSRFFQLGERFIDAREPEFTVEFQILNLAFMSVDNGCISISSQTPSPLTQVATSYQGWVECLFSSFSIWEAETLEDKNAFL